MPKLLLERVARMLKAGFEPRTCYYLSSLLKKGIASWLDNLGNKLRVRVPRSTFAFGIADFQRVLQLGEIFLSFYRVLPDAQLPCLHNMDVLIARYPMHRPSNVQKVRAVYYPELASIQDVVVFPTHGRFPLAEKLSNGDYDGDRYWICWEPLLVEDFQNAPPPVPVDLGSLGIYIDSRLFSDVRNVESFLEGASDFQILEKYAYKFNTLSTPKMVRLSDLRDHLVDAPKNGYRFDMKDWNKFLRDRNYSKKLNKPAYKSLISESPTYQNENNIVDYVKFAVIKERIDQFKDDVSACLGEASTEDEHLSHFYNVRYRDAYTEADQGAREEIDYIVNSLEELVCNWKDANPSRQDYNDSIEQAYTKFRNILPQNLFHLVASEWMRYPFGRGFTT
ncbi:uncharacterized protein K452DRAFT_361680 [Aplosporella prunicola CBS 121167]|uniref:RNA-dependent RNA polymerase n=1 Tax=Aplosporella prunicola CBS 121167 TaxID=1176127 RepID=A0A6A6B4L5_9PEZI|nr:uncharacterized protein K452DRAFT_361680 [Aplosporella prunicola CBS 121167]KAF2137691.1 hypothetical protein K452DRAFT_361680 [Aplosporella prunicola CBS 121167]